jgi:hypothetical protein
MKNFRQFCAAVVLALVFTIFASAGEIPGPGVPNSPPPQQSSITGDIGFPGVTATGDISYPGVAMLDPVTEAALSLLQSIFSIF